MAADQVSRIGSEDRFSVCAHITGSTPGPHILMTGHIDTVPPGDGWTCDPFTPLLRDGRIYGRGSNDMKGGISIILTVFHWACQHREQLSGKLSVVLVPDEEKFSTGVQQVLQSGFSADFALSAEPSYGKLIIGAVGKVLIQGDFIGKRAHGSEPQNGINAISEAAVLTAHLNQLPFRLPVLPQSHSPMFPFVFKEEKLHIPQIFQIIAPYSSISTLFPVRVGTIFTVT